MSADGGLSFEIIRLSGDARYFALMTFTPLQPLLENVEGDIGAFAAIADHNDACGLLLYQCNQGAIQIHSIFVRKDLRRRGIGRALLEALYKSVGDLPIWTRWSSRLAQRAAFEALLNASGGWSGKTVGVMEIATTPKRVIDYANSRPHWRMVNRVGGYTWTLWSQRSAADDEVVRSLIEREDFTKLFDPYVFEATQPIWLVNSMLLRLKGVVAGWILTRKHDDYVIYDCNYVRPDVSRMGAIIPMMVEIFRRQGEVLGPDSAVRYYVNAQTPAMLKIVQGSLRPAHDLLEHFDAMRLPPKVIGESTATNLVSAIPA
jgi:GNAT superfamily N-acetyltransferase